MPLSPEIRAIIDEASQKPLFNTMPIEEARAFIAKMSEGAGWSESLPELGKIYDRTVRGPAGDIPVRVYRPKGDGPFPLVVYFHGGGFALGDLNIDDAMCQRYCHEAEAVVVSVDYRLAPEHKFPAAPEDCYAVTVWAMGDGAAELEIDPERAVTAGMSAGGNLATVVPMMLRDRGEKQVKGQLLQVPVADCPGDPETQSYQQFASGYMLPAEEMYWFWDMYTDKDTRQHPYAAPLRSDDLANLPPAFVLTGECDVLRDEGEAYAAKLKQAGVEVQAIRYDGVDHFVCAFTAVSPISRRAVADKIAWLKDIFAR
ncbi:acetyl esterase [Maritalea mobilis]|uniref:Acetyl esterase n=1 Tax=Maritalea mobilis TaxID=483324 RepID=A0A4R6VQT9_9HYPH|nr:alpha/beta hydrolase [Maritalea mobilis]TDQ61997.1 acetyl esterase [Maritalea mobilis]